MTFKPRRSDVPEGCLFSVALSVELPRLAVSQHPALWSSDFPPVQQNLTLCDTGDHPAHSAPVT